MTPEATKSLMAYFHFPSNSEQLEEYFNEGGLADVAIEVVGNAYATKEKPALADYSVTIDTSFLK